MTLAANPRTPQPAGPTRGRAPHHDSTSQPDPRRAARRRAVGLGLVLIAQLMLILDMTVVNVALPKIRTDLDFSPSGLSWVLNAYTLTFGGLLLLGGRLGDVLGRRRTFLAGLGVFALGSLIGGLSPDSTVLVAARALQGIGAAVAAPSVLALVTTQAETPAARNRALALFSAVSSAGGSIGLLLGGVLTSYASWRWSLFINLPLAVVVLTLVPRLVAETPRQRGHFDVTGALTSTLGSAGLVYAFINAPDHGWGSVGTLGGFAVAAILLTTFVLHERRAAAPLLALHLLEDRARVGAIAAMALFIGAQASFFFYSVQFLHNVLGYGAFRSGLAFLPLTAMIFATSRVTPMLVGRYGARPLLLVGLTLGVIANVMLSGLNTDSTYVVHLLIPMILSGTGAGLSFMPITATVLSGVAPEHAGSASGLLQTGQQVGSALGLAVLVSVTTSHQVAGDITSGLSWAFGGGAVLVGLALLVAAILLPRRRREPVAVPAQEEYETAA